MQQYIALAEGVEQVLAAVQLLGQSRGQGRVDQVGTFDLVQDRH